MRSESSFEDYKKLVCISEQEITIESKKPSKRKSLKYWIGFAILFAIFYAVGQIDGEKIFSLFKSEKISQEVLSQNG